jgi:hypothetical protein
VDAVYFLKQRTNFIRYYYDTALAPFKGVQSAVENGKPPFDDPPYSEDPEPAFLDEWMDAEAATRILGITCVSMLSDTLKLYFEALQHRVIAFDFVEPKKNAFEKGFVDAYFSVLGPILDTDWSDWPVDLSIFEQVVLVRNRGQHPESLSSLGVDYDVNMLKKHPITFFATDEERETWAAAGDPASLFMMGEIQVTKDRLFAAISEVEKLAEWIDGRMDKAMEWRERQARG